MLQALLASYLKRIGAITLIFLSLGTAARLLFLFLFAPSDWRNFSTDLPKAFFLGLRFDLTVLCYVHSIPLLLLFSFLMSILICQFFNFREGFVKVQLEKIYNFIFSSYYLLFLWLIVLFTTLDTFYYGYYHDRFNVLIFGLIEDDTRAILKTVWKNDPVLSFFFGQAMAAIGIFWLLKKLQIRFPVNVSSLGSTRTSAAICFLVFIVNGIGARGSLGLFPLSEMDTHISKSLFINILSYNSIHALSRAVQNKNTLKGSWDANLRDFGYSDNHKKALADFFEKPVEEVPDDFSLLIKKQTPKNAWAEKNRPHVLLLVMESFGAYWAQYDQSEFDLLADLKTHFQEDFYTLKMLSGTGSTIGSLSSLIAGVPQKTTSEFLPEGPYMQIPFRTAPAYNFRQAGYKTRFIYGGNPGWRDINKYAHTQFFENIEGETDIEKKLSPRKLERHDWGIYDEDLWDYVWKTLKEAKDPQFILAMTTTNHPPYQLPSTYKDKELKIPDDLKPRIIGDMSVAKQRFRAFRYSNQKLASFLNQIKASPLRDKVVIAVTGDHTFWLINFAENQFMKKGSVPFYFYSTRPKTHQKKEVYFASHADIPATLYEEALSESPYYSFNKSIFNPSRKNVALTAFPFIASDEGALMLFPKQLNRKTYLSWDTGYQTLSIGNANPKLDSYGLYYRSLMGSLDLYFKFEKDNFRQNANH